MATFSARFLGCKVSFADAQAIRERLLADGHTEVERGGDVAVVNTCCVTHEAVSKSRQAVSRASRTHGRVYVTGCAGNLEGAFTQVSNNVTVVSAKSEALP
ncbi:MAG: 2-methylthioadenine synthetase, partial [Actinomycetota bacterium]|nr:2-methylthioadenine synthetase [Actinomycetota bacterium]